MRKLFTKTLFLGLAFLFGGILTTSAQGDGTFENPYTVNDLLAMPPFTSTTSEDPYINVWVEGYIVGALVVNFGTISDESWIQTNFGSIETIYTNVVLAQAADESDYTKLVPIQLPLGGVIREQINLKDNPDNYQAHFKIQGSLAQYFQVNGVRDTKAQSGDFVIEPPLTTGIDTNINGKGFVVSTDGSNLVISVEKSANISIYSTLGKLIYSGASIEGQNIIPLTKGQVYIVKAGSEVAKIIL